MITFAPGNLRVPRWTRPVHTVAAGWESLQVENPGGYVYAYTHVVSGGTGPPNLPRRLSPSSASGVGRRPGGKVRQPEFPQGGP